MKFFALFLALVSTSFFVSADSDKSLTEQLKERAEVSAQNSPQKTRMIMENAIEELRNSTVMQSALKKGDKIPKFSLNDVKRGKVDSHELLKKGPLIITFYRGGWCPYCNLQLRDLQKHLATIKAQGAELVAISPERPDKTAETIKKQDLKFYVLSDNKGEVADLFGLTYKLPSELIDLYKKFGINLKKANGTSEWELPLSATYIVNKNAEIVYAFVDADYKKRAETKELVRILKSL